MKSSIDAKVSFFRNNKLMIIEMDLLMFHFEKFSQVNDEKSYWKKPIFIVVSWNIRYFHGAWSFKGVAYTFSLKNVFRLEIPLRKMDEIEFPMTQYKMCVSKRKICCDLNDSIHFEQVNDSFLVETFYWVNWNKYVRKRRKIRTIQRLEICTEWLVVCTLSTNTKKYESIRKLYEWIRMNERNIFFSV